VTPKEVLALCREKDVKSVDMRFMDFPGLWQHFTIPVDKLDEDVFEDGLGFDGSSIRGWQRINESDMLVVPQPETATIDPFCTIRTLSMICNIQDPVTREDYTRDPRNVARKAVNYLKSTGIADTCSVGPEAEFFIFDDELRLLLHRQHRGAMEPGTRRGSQPGLQAALQGGLLPRSARRPVDEHPQRDDARLDRVRHRGRGPAPRGGHGRAGGDRHEDQMMMYKYIIKNVAKRHDKSVTFMPKPLYGDNGSGMHCHLSLWKGGEPLFAGSGYAGLSDMALYALGGLLKHAPSLCAFTNPTTNSYKRLVPGFEAPVNLAYSQRNRSAACRIPMYSPNPKAKRIEYRCPDPSCNPYLAFSALLMAMIDGIQNKIDPGEPLDKDIYDLSPEEMKDVPQTPGSLAEALAALRKDHDYLLRGDVFTADVIDTWIWYKTENEVDALRLRPHPYEFCLYYEQ